MKLIDKDALVAEIERRIKVNKECMLGLKHLDYYQGKVDALNDTISSLNTLEVKEVYNVWHDASETPKGAGDKEILVQFSDWHTSVLEIDDWEYLDHQTKWAYLKDLI